jgi:hypothetical protein
MGWAKFDRPILGYGDEFPSVMGARKANALFYGFDSMAPDARRTEHRESDDRKTTGKVFT